MKKSERNGRMVFADPTRKRVYLLSVLLLAAALTLLFLRLFYPLILFHLRYALMTARLSTVRLYNRIFLGLMGVNVAKLFLYALAARKAKRQSTSFCPAVTAVIPAYNEEKTIVATVRSVLAAEYQKLDVIVVDDGSKDRTLEILRAEFGGDPRVTILTKENGGKSSALNLGIAHAKGPLLLLLDADTMIAPDSVRLLAAHFGDARVAAVSGNTRVGNVHNLITRFQRVEYIRDFNLMKNGMARFNAQAVVPGALGMWRKAAILACGGFSRDTLGEDRDLSMALLKHGWRTEFEPLAFSDTEAPDTLRGFLRQRFRWTYSTLQCERKYLSCLFNPRRRGLGLLLMPDLLILQTILPLVTTVGFVANLVAFDAYECKLLAVSYAVSVAIELILFLFARRITGERISVRDLLAVLPQRIIYGVLCTFLLFKSVVYAFIGTTVLWNKVERKGNSRQPPGQTSAQADQHKKLNEWRNDTK
ncbi:MAG: glycosyltransferase family 2 protein [Clostridia bacterium]|nr:glycosyltransferase family 2 protein [Clostridia bacterium]